MQHGIEKSSKACPPHVVFLGKKRVSFEGDNQVFSYKTEITREVKSKLWYASAELEDFRSRRRDGDSDDDDSSTGSGATAYNHTRRILFNYESYRRMEKGSDLLRDVSELSSKRSRDQARDRAVKLSKSNSTWEMPQNEIMKMVGWNPRVADFYLESFMDMVESGWLCGGSRKEID